MKHFTLKYFLFLGLLFGLLYAPLLPLAGYLNTLQTELILYGLSHFLEAGQLEGIDIWITPHYKIIITQACNGMIPLLFLYASYLAYPAPWYYKLRWMGIGYVSFLVVNIGRIVLVVRAVEREGGQGNFYWSHDLVGNLLLMGVGLLLFVRFIQRARVY